MAVTATAYGQFLLDLLKARHQFPANEIRVALFTSSYTPNYNTDKKYDEIQAHEVPEVDYANGEYLANGIALFNVTWTYDAASRSAVLGASPISWGSLNATFRYAVLYNTNGNYLIGAIDFGENKTYNDESFDLSFDDGVIAITAA